MSKKTLFCVWVDDGIFAVWADDEQQAQSIIGAIPYRHSVEIEHDFAENGILPIRETDGQQWYKLSEEWASDE